ncbi:MAG: HAD family hydrolase [bacterium]|nr:HAD family hydrolase [bacterium]
MKFILECDGVVLNPEPQYWAAYSVACEALGLPRLDRAAFWRAVRRGTREGQLVRGAKPAQLIEFGRRYSEALDSDAAVAAMAPLSDVAVGLTALGDHGPCYLVSTGPNRQKRQDVLDTHNLAIHFTRMKALSDDRGARTAQLTHLAENNPRCVAACASPSMILAAEAAGLFAVGVGSGACSTSRLTQAGARCVFADAGELADSVAAGARQLVEAGLVPATGSY